MAAASLVAALAWGSVAAGQDQDGTEVITVRVSTTRSADLIRVTFSDNRTHVPPVALRFDTQITADPSGLPIKMEGRYFQVLVFGQVGLPPRRSITRVVTSRRKIVRQVKLAGDSEGQVSYGIGLARKVRPRVTQSGHTVTLRYPRS